MKKALLTFIVTTICLNTNAQNNSFNNENICKAGIATVMFRPVSIIHTYKKTSDIFYLYYIRNNDNTKWTYKCKINQNRILWGSPNGRWRNHSRDSKVTFEIHGNTLAIAENYSDNSKNQKSFNLKDFK